MDAERLRILENDAPVKPPARKPYPRSPQSYDLGVTSPQPAPDGAPRGIADIDPRWRKLAKPPSREAQPVSVGPLADETSDPVGCPHGR